MAWTQLTLDVPDDLVDTIVGAFHVDGAARVWESDSPAPGLTRLVAYFSLRSDIEKIQGDVHTIFQRVAKQTPAMSRALVEERDWTEEWKKSYTSFPIADSFFVMPSWEDSTCPN